MILILNWLAVILLIITVTGLLLSRDWRWNLGILAIQYLGVFWLTYAHWPFPMAVVKLLTGWTACAALGMTQINLDRQSKAETAWPQSRFFRVATAGLVGVVSLALAFRISQWLGMELSVSWGSLLLMGMGLLYVGMTTQPMRIVVGLLTFLAGFEILYAAVETSVLVATLLAVITLGLTLAGAYLINVAAKEEMI
jgi:hypothetical protein